MNFNMFFCFIKKHAHFQEQFISNIIVGQTTNYGEPGGCSLAIVTKCTIHDSAWKFLILASLIGLTMIDRTSRLLEKNCNMFVHHFPSMLVRKPRNDSQSTFTSMTAVPTHPETPKMR